MEASHLFFVGKDESLMASSLHSLLNKTVKFSKFCVIDDEKIINISKPLDARNF
jgi:predicted subunit of tRNA(5-methylaminomethyl-2-thiouridylate) methyltransferase